MLNGHQYFSVFPDEKPLRPSLLASSELSDALAALQLEFQQFVANSKDAARDPADETTG